MTNETLQKRILALDVGDTRIGIAISDPLCIIANGLLTYQRVGINADTSYIMRLIKDYDCGTVLIGLPLSFGGSESTQTEHTRAFTQKLENKLRSNSMQHVKIVFEDERFTTKIAEKVLIAADMSRAKRKKIIDKQAAVIILQDYLTKISIH